MKRKNSRLGENEEETQEQMKRKYSRLGENEEETQEQFVPFNHT